MKFLALHSVLTLTLLSALTGCQHTSTKPTESWQFELNQAVPIPAQATRAFIQQGELIPKTRLNERLPHCQIEVKTLAEETRTVFQDQFKVIRMGYGTESIVQTVSPIQFASIAPISRLAFQDDGPPQVVEKIEFYLSSAKQPDVLRLVCAGSLSDGSPIDYPDNVRPTPDKANSILGPIGQLIRSAP